MSPSLLSTLAALVPWPLSISKIIFHHLSQIFGRFYMHMKKCIRLDYLYIVIHLLIGLVSVDSLTDKFFSDTFLQIACLQTHSPFYSLPILFAMYKIH